MLVIFLGSIGGFISMGFIGLFIGAVVLSLGFKLFQAWLESDSSHTTATDRPAALAGDNPKVIRLFNLKSGGT
jgi:predicted PurR-regulated permease PerM